MKLIDLTNFTEKLCYLRLLWSLQSFSWKKFSNLKKDSAFCLQLCCTGQHFVVSCAVQGSIFEKFKCRLHWQSWKLFRCYFVQFCRHKQSFAACTPNFPEASLFAIPFSIYWMISLFSFKNLFVSFLFTANIFLNYHWIKTKFLECRPFEKKFMFFIWTMRVEFQLLWNSYAKGPIIWRFPSRVEISTRYTELKKIAIIWKILSQVEGISTRVEMW